MNRADLVKTSNLIMVRQISAALEIVEAALRVDPDDFDALLAQIKALRADRRLDEALVVIDRSEILAERSGRPDLRAILAYQRGMILIRLQAYEQALVHLREAVEAGPNADHYGALCLVLGYLGRMDEVVRWRSKVLMLHDEAARCAPQEVIAAERPRSFDPAKRSRNIVSYCLFGSDSYYHECAITNARMTSLLFPEFTARFYCASDLPEAVLKVIRATGSQVLLARAEQFRNTSSTAGTFWRFLAFDDPNVDVVLCRDVDSPILPRERAAIDLWLASEAPFYGIRDHPLHAELILAGMWGGFTGLLPPLTPLTSRFAASNHSRTADQHFLRTTIWPRVRDRAFLSIDSIRSLEGSVDFPAGFPNRGRNHVGMSWTRQEILGGG